MFKVITSVRNLFIAPSIVLLLSISTACTQVPAQILDKSHNVYNDLEKSQNMKLGSYINSPLHSHRNSNDNDRNNSTKVQNYTDDLYDDLENEDLSSSTQPSNSQFQMQTPLGRTDFTWPAYGKILKRYDRAAGHEGINIELTTNAPVLSAADGEVIYTGDDLAEYGNLIIIRHTDNILTAYAHLNKINVKKGTKVRKNEAIGQAGKTGNVNSTQLHFSIRKNDVTINPERKL